MKRWVLVATACVLFGCKGCKDDGEGEIPPGLEHLVLEVCDNGEDDDGDGLADCEQPACRTRESCAFEPPDPSEMAPPLDPKNLADFADATRFLYAGDNPVVRGVDEDLIDEGGVAVLRARIMDTSGEMIRGAAADIAGQPGLGYTFSREDGGVDLVANGGQLTTVRVRAPGYLPVDRTIDPSQRDYATVDDVVLTPIDEKVSRLEDGGLAVGSAVVDDDGERTARVWFPAGTVATVNLPDGQTGELSAFDVRITEYTVGDLGPAAMPAELPPGTEYTYAVELSLDEAEAVGASDVEFSNTGSLYLDNFLGFEVGETVPSGFYDRTRRSWAATDDGRVARLLDGGVDLDGDGTADPLSGDELDAIRKTFDVGDEFWRVPVNHFSPYDCNWPVEERGILDLLRDFLTIVPNPCMEPGSALECENRVVTKSVPLPGTGMTLEYRSDRGQGQRGFTLPLTPDEISDGLLEVKLQLEVQGREFEETFEPAPNLTYTFQWDGRDAYGRLHYGPAQVSVRIGYVFGDPFGAASAAVGASFGGDAGGAVAPARVPQTRWMPTYRYPLNSIDAKAMFNMGGWALDVQNAYNGELAVSYPAGEPERRGGEISKIVSAVVNSDQLAEPFDGNLGYIASIGIAPDGSLFMQTYPSDTSSAVIMRLSPDGELEHFAGRFIESGLPEGCRNDFDGEDVPTDCGEGGDPKDAILIPFLLEFLDMEVGPDGAVYLARPDCIRRVTEETVELFAGRCLDEENPDTDEIAISPSGEFFTSDGRNIHRLDPNTGAFEQIAGCLSMCGDSFDDGVADPLDSSFHVNYMSAAPDGSLYFHSNVGRFIRLNAGRLTVLYEDEAIQRIRITPTGRLLGFLDAPEGGTMLARFEGENVIPLAGYTGSPIDVPPGAARDNAPAFDALLSVSGTAHEAPDGKIYLTRVNVVGSGDGGFFTVSALRDAFPSTVRGDEALLSSADGRRLHRFSPEGLPLDITSALSGAPIVTFGYDDGVIDEVASADGLTTAIERDGDGELAAIVGPYGHRTEFELDANGYINAISYPDGTERRASYDESGWMTSWTDGTGAESNYEYDEYGFLVRATDAEGEWKTFGTNGFDEQMESSSGRSTNYEADRTTRVFTDSDGLVWQTDQSADGSFVAQSPDGTLRATDFTGDPRFGTMSAYPATHTVATPSGLERSVSVQREVELSDSLDLASLTTFTETRTINEAVTTYQYDAAIRTFSRTSPEGRTASATYDDAGRPISWTLGDQLPLTLEYDDDGRLSALAQGDVRVAAAYGSDGGIDEISASGQPPIAFTRDAMGRLLSESREGGRTREFVYDDQGRTTAVGTSSGNDYSAAYNTYSQMTSLSLPDGELDSYTWTSDRLPDGVTRANGQSQDVTYDVTGHAESWTTARGSFDRERDPVTGQVVRATSPDSTIDITWDGFLATRFDVEISGVTATIERVFDNDFRLASRSIDGNELAYEYDDDGLTTVAGAATITRDRETPFITAIEVRDARLQLDRDDIGRVTSMSYTVDRTELFARAYTYDGLRIATIDETVDGTTTQLSYNYDADGAVVEVLADGTPRATYEYDERANRTTIDAATATYDVANRIESAGARTYQTDNAGFVTGWQDGTDDVTLSYDHFELTRADVNGTTIDYGYDSLGRRVSRTVDGALEQAWLYDDFARPVAELDGTGQIVARFVYAMSNNVPTYMVRGTQTYFFITEENGTVRRVVHAATGDVVQELTYDPLGAVVADTNPGFQPFGFAGGLHDPITGLVRLGARDYDPFVGRWTARDPSAFAGGQYNLHAYVDNDFVNKADPTGYIAGPVIVIEGGFLAAVDVKTRWDRLRPESNQLGRLLASRVGMDVRDAQNALRHCTLQCDLGRANQLYAETAGYYHEVPFVPRTVLGGGLANADGGVYEFDRRADEHNNECGRQNSTRPGPCTGLCANDLMNGKLASDETGRSLRNMRPDAFPPGGLDGRL